MVKKRTKRIQDAIGKMICVACGKDIRGMRDKLSIKEYLISGLCQDCQDDVFT